MCTWYFRPKHRTLYSSYNFILFFPLGNINKYGLSARIAKFHGDSLGTGADWSKSPEECLWNSTSRWRWCRCFAWMLLGVHSVQYFAETQMHHQLCYPVSQPSIPAKEENEVRVSIQVLQSLLPLHSMTTNHAFNSLNWHQTQPVSSLLAPLPFSNVLRSYDWGWSISFMGSFISPGGSPGWEARGAWTSSSLSRHALYLSLTTWPHPCLFCPVQSKACSLWWRKSKRMRKN